MSTSARPTSRLSRFQKILLGIVITVALILGLAAWLVPKVTRNVLTENVAEMLGRPIQVGDISFNPFSLTLRIHDLAIEQKDAEPLLAIARTEASVSWRSLFWLAPVVDSVIIQQPRAVLAREDLTRFNLSDIIDRLAANATNDEPKEPSDGPPRFALSNMVLEDGSITLNDALTGRQHVVDQIGIGVPFVSSFAYAATIKVQPYVHLRVNGSPFAVDGVALPFDEVPSTSLDLSLDDLGLEQFADAWPLPVPVKLASARLDSKLQLLFEQPVDASPRLRVVGDVGLRKFDLRDANDGVLAKWDELRIQGVDLAPLAQTLDVASIALDNPHVYAKRDAQGVLNWQTLIPKSEPAKASSEHNAAKPAETADNAATDGDATSSSTAPDTAVNPSPDPAQAPAEQSPEAPGAEQTATDATPATPDDAASQSWRVAVNDIQINGTGLHLQDLALPLNYDLTNLSLNVASLNWPPQVDQPVQVKLDMPAANGVPSLHAKGNLALAPFALTANAELAEMSLKPFAQAVRKMSPVQLENGLLSLSGRVQAGIQDGAFQVEANEVKAGLNQLALKDESVKPAVPVTLDKLDIAVQRLALDSTPTPFTVDATGFNGKGRLALKGELTPMPVSVKTTIDASDLQLAPFAAYAADSLNATVRSVALGLRGNAAFAAAHDNAPMKAEWQGNVDVTGLHLIDRVNKADFLTWNKLALANMHVTTEGDKFSANLGDIALDNFYGRILLSAEGRLNVMDLVAEPGKAGGSITQDSPAPKPEAAEQPKPKKSGPPPDLSIASIKLTNGRMTFTDRFVKPNYTAELSKLEGSLSAISARKPQPAKVNVTGRVYGTAPLSVSGTVQPFSDFLSLDLHASTKGVDLPKFTTYSAKYVGYPIQKGKLSVDLKYQIEDRKLQASNHVVLNQLTFGDKTDSPDAIKLPVLLAVALLKDSKGDIDINLPVAGSLDDPEFSVGGIVLRVFMNLIVKAVTSPFSLLASAFGGDEELSYIDFAPGEATLSEDAESRLATLATALNDRPALKMDIAGHADPVGDIDGMRSLWLEQQFKIAKAKESGSKTDPDSVTVTPEDRARLMEEVYDDADIEGKPRNFIGVAKSVPVEQMEQLLLAGAPIDDDALRKLADARAEAVYERLVETIPADRIFIVAPVLDGEPGEGDAPPARVEFALK